MIVYLWYFIGADKITVVDSVARHEEIQGEGLCVNKYLLQFDD